ncbi:MAG: hypothetical protein II350_09680, partial [Clostridia bacterium]|nr:hypothetical protein [Clostridia bacterium]
GVCPEKAENAKYFRTTISEQQEAINIYADINGAIVVTSELDRLVSEEFYSFNDKYKDTYREEIEIVNELFLELSMYAEHALEPTSYRSLEIYLTETEKYNNTIDRLIKESTLK